MENPLIIEYADENAMGTITIQKTDAETDAVLGGAVFEIVGCRGYCHAGTARYALPKGQSPIRLRLIKTVQPRQNPCISENIK